MLNRRHLRVKVMHSLYAFFQSNNSDLRAGEKELNHSLEKVYDLYIHYLSLLPEIAEVALNISEDAAVEGVHVLEECIAGALGADH